MNQTFLYVWLSVMALVLVASPLVRKIKGQKLPVPQDFVIAAFAFGGTITLFRVLIKVITSESLQAELEWDGTLALCISASLGIYLSLKEVFRLF